MIQDIHPHRFDNTFVVTSEIKEDEHVFHFVGNELLLKQNGETIEFPKKKDFIAIGSAFTFLFTLNKKRCFLVWDCQHAKGNEFAYHPITFRNPFLQKEIDWACSVALQIKNWHEHHKFCGKCGSKSLLSTTERAISCPSCETSLYPTISPAIIVAILCKDRILLARNALFPEAFFSLVAGYVDIGESIEDAVAREAKEEVGLEVTNIRYYKSQPWPFSGSMMIGYIAEAKEGQKIQIDNNEIVEAAWYSRNNLPSHPPNRSIAGEIIEKFVLGTL